MHEVLQEDQELFLYLNNLGDRRFDNFWLMVSETWIWVPLYVIFLYLLYKQYKLKNLLYILVFIALGVTVSDQLSGIFKYGIARLRPCHEPGLEDLMREVKCGGQFGFYSAHASNTFFIATFMSIMLRNKLKFLPWILFAWAAMVSYSRIYLGVHYPADILMGAAMGFFIGGFFATLSLKVIHKRKISQNLASRN